MARKYQICTRCIMDTSDPEIHFDENGVCSHCKRYDEMAKRETYYDETGQQKLKKIIKKIKKKGRNKRYDCIIGVSGGTDSTFMAYHVKQLSLRPLAVHLDNGWDSELAVNNIENLLKKLSIDLFTKVIEWEEFKDLQLAFLRASTPDSEIPTDHAILAILFQVAANNNIRYIITGQNVVTEGYSVPSWSQGHGDWQYIRNIHKKFGKLKKIDSFPRQGILRTIHYKLFKRIKIIPILNYIPYEKKEAFRLLEKELDWRPYGGKHLESKYTHFFQSYILPRKFRIDKRRIHLSALISSGQMTREEALAEMEKELYSPEQLKKEKEYVLKKFELHEEEFENIMSSPPKSFKDYPSYKNHPLIKNKLAMSVYRLFLRD